MLKTMAFALLASFLLSSVALADEIEGRVVSVADADTITFLDASNTQHKIRFEGIDAPEKSQDYGTKGTDALNAAIAGNPVSSKTCDAVSIIRRLRVASMEYVLYLTDF